MQSVWHAVGLVAAMAFVLAGCVSEPPKLPKHPEEYTIPPAEDARYSQPPAYPKNVLNQDRIPTIPDGSSGPKGGKMGRPGGGGPSGGPGGSY